MEWLGFWITVAIITLIVEVFTVSFVSLWFTVGAVVAIFVSLAGGNAYLQWATFLIVSVVTLLICRKIFIKKLKAGDLKGLEDRYINSEGVVTQEIDNSINAGEIKIDGQLWRAKSINGDIIPKNSQVVIEQRTGNTVFVKIKN